jgi:N-acetylgalactosamine-6-sulfatase
VGKILQKLVDLGIANNTLAVFSSDNGAATYAKEQGQ